MSDVLERLRAALQDRYRIEDEIGQGGMATVYRAIDLRHERKVALKVLRPELAATLEPERFLQEVRVTANLQHPHILPLFDSGEADGFLYYVMPLVDGESLRERLARERELPVDEALRITREVTDALAAAHELGVVHRDIKPDNVLLAGRHAVVTDFGVAKAVSEATGRHQLTTAGVALGTPAYMAPEQAAADEHVDHRADIYAVGAMAYELLTGRPPFTGLSPQQVLAAHVTETPQEVTELRAAVPPSLGAVVMRCLEKKPADRWQTAELLLTQLEALGTPSMGVTPTQALPDSRPRPPLPWIAGAVALVAILIAGLWPLARGDFAAPGDGASGAAGGAVADVEPGFVVVPFENQSGVDSLDVFGAVMADFLTSQVSRNGIAWVAPASNVRDFARERPAGSDVVAYFSGGTGARYVVTGSYFPQGSSLVIQAEVTDAATSELVATVGPMEGPLHDFMEAARTGTDQILGVLARVLDPGTVGFPARVAGQPRSYAAYRDYVEGMELFDQAERARARDLVYQAVAADSTFAEALLMAAVLEWQLGDIARADSLIQVTEGYRADLAPGDLVCLDSLQAWIEGDREAAWRAGRRFSELDPVTGGDERGARMANRPREAVDAAMRTYRRFADPPISVGYWWFDLLSSLHLLGEHDTELEYARDAREKHPDDWRTLRYEIMALGALGRADGIRELIAVAEERAVEGAWDFPTVLSQADHDIRPHGQEALADSLSRLAVRWCDERGERTAPCARALYRTGEMERARTLFEELLAEAPEDVTLLGWLGSTAARQGDRDAALTLSQRLAEIEARPYTYGGATGWRAAIAAELGDRQGAVALLEQAYRDGLSYSVTLRHRTQYLSLQGYPPYERFMEPRG
jgi:tRNA A-37 threonylcarbamoyl transferase component Bud32/tetratricopeptide (TPR) repeat protein